MEPSGRATGSVPFLRLAGTGLYGVYGREITGKGLSEVATELGLSPGQLSGWRNQHLAAGSAEAETGSAAGAFSVVP